MQSRHTIRWGFVKHTCLPHLKIPPPEKSRFICSRKKNFDPRFKCEAKFFGFYTPIYALKRLKMRLFHSKSRKFSNFDLFFRLKMDFFWAVHMRMKNSENDEKSRFICRRNRRWGVKVAEKNLN